MFKKYFKLRHEKIYFYSYLVTLISLFLPWIRVIHVFVPGIILPFGGITVILLTFSAIHFWWAKIKEKVLLRSNIFFGFLCLLSCIGHFMGYQPTFNFYGGLFAYSFGVYLAIIGSLGIIISGIVGLKEKKRKERIG